MPSNLFKQQMIEDVVVVKLLKRLARENVPEFKENIIPLMEKSESDKLILDLSDVEWVDSAGIGVLVLLYKRMKEKDKLIKFVHNSQKLTEIFTILKLDKIFEILPDVDTAVNSF